MYENIIQKDMNKFRINIDLKTYIIMNMAQAKVGEFMKKITTA